MSFHYNAGTEPEEADMYMDIWSGGAGVRFTSDISPHNAHSMESSIFLIPIERTDARFFPTHTDRQRCYVQICSVI